MGMILLIDFEKAFDSLKWDHLESVIKVHNFGEDFKTVLILPNFFVIIKGLFFDSIITGEIQSSDYLKSNQ